LGRVIVTTTISEDISILIPPTNKLSTGDKSKSFAIFGDITE
jgi:hypothetical protein